MISRSAITGRIVSVAEALRNPDTTVTSKSYPYYDEDVIVLGPECFLSSDGEIISWRGTNYMRQSISSERPPMRFDSGMDSAPGESP